MGRYVYTDYVRHCLRFYARYDNPTFKTETAKTNWSVCKEVLDTFPESDKALLLFVYRERDTVSDNIYALSKAKNIPQDKLWNMVKKLEREIAIKRGLLE